MHLRALPRACGQGDRMWRRANAWARGCPEPLVFVSPRKGVAGRPACFCRRERAPKKYNRSAMEIARQLQGKALRRREKNRRRRNNEEQWKKQCAEQWKQSDIRARADASPGHIGAHRNKSPAAERRRAPHRSKTRISAIAHPSAERTLKSAPVIPAGPSKTSAILAHTRWPCACGRGRGGGAACSVLVAPPLCLVHSRYRRRAVTSISTFISGL